MAGPQDPAAAGGDQLRAGHADREQVIETLKDAFVHGRLTKDELDTRAGQALSARTRADLAALTTDIPAVPSAPAAAGPTRPPAPARRRPLARACAAAGICLLIAAAAIGAGLLLPADQGGSSPWIGLMVVLAVSGVWTAIGIMGCAVVTSLDQRPSRRQLPPRPAPGGHALQAGQHGGTDQIGDDPALPRDRSDQTRADLQPDGSRPGRPHSSGRGARTPRGVRTVPDAV